MPKESIDLFALSLCNSRKQLLVFSSVMFLSKPVKRRQTSVSPSFCWSIVECEGWKRELLSCSMVFLGSLTADDSFRFKKQKQREWNRSREKNCDITFRTFCHSIKGVRTFSLAVIDLQNTSRALKSEQQDPFFIHCSKGSRDAAPSHVKLHLRHDAQPCLQKGHFFPILLLFTNITFNEKS